MNAVAVVAAITLALQPARMSRTIEKGDQSHVDQPTQVVVRDQSDWQRLWQRRARKISAPANGLLGITPWRCPLAPHKLACASDGRSGPEHPDSGFKELASTTQLVQRPEE